MKFIKTAVCLVILLGCGSSRSLAQDTEDLKPFEAQILKTYQDLAETADRLQDSEREMARLLGLAYTRTVLHHLRLAKDAQEANNRKAASDELARAADEADKLLQEGGAPFVALRKRIYGGRAAAPSAVLTEDLQTRLEAFIKDTRRISRAIAPSRFVSPGRKGDVERLTGDFKVLIQAMGF